MRHSYLYTTDICTVYGILERVAELNQCNLIEPSQAWQSWGSKPTFPAELSSSYGDWKALTNHCTINPNSVYLLVPYCGGSDYSGNLCEVSNHKAIIDAMPSDYEDGEQYLNYHGDFGTFDIGIRLDALTPDLLDMIEGLEDYPLADESLHSELEMESQNEAWENSIRSDFRQALCKALVAEFESSHASDQLDGETDEVYQSRYDAAIEFLEDGAGINDSDLAELCWKMAELANEYWSNEQGSDSWLDVERVVTKALAHKQDSEWSRKAYNEVKNLIQSAMGDDKYTHGILKYINPNQTSFEFVGAN